VDSFASGIGWGRIGQAGWRNGKEMDWYYRESSNRETEISYRWGETNVIKLFITHIFNACKYVYVFYMPVYHI
jgi:hypothetical protein